MAEYNAAGETRAAVGHGFTALATGVRLSDRYVIDHVIAHGGFGITYGGRHEGLGRAVAIKEHFPRQFAYRDGTTSAVRPSDPGTYAWALDRFLAEGRALATCKHPNVVDVSDVFEANGTAYMVLGYEEGHSLAAWLAALGRPPSQAELDAILTPLLDALAFVHDKGLLHRDIAPDNIMIRRDGKPCLIDFGAARQAIAERSQVMSAIVKTGYSPPEQYTTAGRNQGAWSDIYALGATLYRAVTGQAPPEATERTLGDTMRPAVESAAGRDYRPGFLAAIDSALQVPTAGRPQTVTAWRAMLFGAMGSDPAGLTPHTKSIFHVAASSPSNVATVSDPRGLTPPRRSRAPLLAAAFAILALATAGGWYGFAHLPAQQALERARFSDETRQLVEAGLRQAAEAEKQRLALLDQQKRDATEAETKRKTEEEAQSTSKSATGERQHQEEAEATKSGRVFRDCTDGCPEMVVVPAGRFTMGSSTVEIAALKHQYPSGSQFVDWEIPQREVKIRQSFAAGKFEVTFAEWDVCVSAGGCKRKPGDQGWGRGRRPVINVSWNEAKEYVAWLSKKTGKPYRLLTEAEWEYAARGGKGDLRYWWGNEPSHEYANYGADTCCSGVARGRDKWVNTAPVGEFTANPFGLHDLHGNVWEWVQDCWIDSYRDAPANEAARASGACDWRVLRGGSWDGGPVGLRSASRNRTTPVDKNTYIGFRLARTIDP